LARAWQAVGKFQPKIDAVCEDHGTISVGAEPFHVIHMSPMSDVVMRNSLLGANLCHSHVSGIRHIGRSIHSSDIIKLVYPFYIYPGIFPMIHRYKYLLRWGSARQYARLLRYAACARR
jgi:hypothetical protein